MPESGRGMPQSLIVRLEVCPKDLSVCEFSSQISSDTPVMTPPLRGGVCLSTRDRVHDAVNNEDTVV